MPCFKPRNNPSVVGTTRNTGRLHREVRTLVLLSASTRLIFKTSCVDFGINQCAINCLTLLNSALAIGMQRFAERTVTVYMPRGYLGCTMPIRNTFCIVTRIAP